MEIQNLSGKFQNEIVEFLLDQGKQPFKIFIPKSTQLYLSTRESIAVDYLKLAYSGELLCEVSDSIHYKSVPPANNESVLFEVRTSRIEKLAEVLFKISFGYVNDSEDEIYTIRDEGFEFDMFADQFSSDVDEGKVKPFCDDFVKIYNEFLLDEE